MVGHSVDLLAVALRSDMDNSTRIVLSLSCIGVSSPIPALRTDDVHGFANWLLSLTEYGNTRLFPQPSAHSRRSVGLSLPFSGSVLAAPSYHQPGEGVKKMVQGKQLL